MSFSAGDTASPFSSLGVDGPSFSLTTANAIDAHLREIASIRQLTDDGQGTVLAVVTFPKDDKSSRACDGESWHDIRFRMDYGKLTVLGSKKIQDMFSPRAQARFRRHLNLQQLPPGVDYVLDFTPPSEGSDLADLTAALWLPRIVKLWFLAGLYVPDPVLENGLGGPTRPLADKAVGAILTLGHDDVCKGLKCLTNYGEWLARDGLPGIIEDDPSARLGFIAAWRKVEDYCPIRHRVAIVRVLKAINGDDLLLNSAVRLWTVAQVAISLEVPQVVVGPVTQWLVAPPNTKFIEICPERAFQLAHALKIPSVLIAAFKILVNELAIDYASSNPLPGRAPLTWAQRRRDDYGDYPSDPVEYASRALAERMSAKLNKLQSDDIFNNLPIRIPEWEKLSSWGTLINTHAPNSPLQTSHQHLTTALLATFRGWVDNALELKHFHNRYSGRFSDLLEAQRRHYISTKDLKPLISLYGALNPAQKTLTPFFWDALARTKPLYEFRATAPPLPANGGGGAGRSLTRLAEAFNTALRGALVNSAFSPQDAAFPPDTPLLANLDFVHHPTDFHLPAFHAALSEATKTLCAAALPRARYMDSSDCYYGGGGGGGGGVPFFLSDHLLLALEEKELNYLPIWADGLDDGSGGVFQEAIPPAEMGPSEPGPGYHTGWTEAGTEAGTEGGHGTERGVAESESSTTAASDLGLGGLSLGEGGGSGSGTAGRSLQAQESGAGSSVTEGRVGVVSVPSLSASESFTVDDESVYADARFSQPAAHQAQGQAIERYVDEAEAEDGRGGGGDGMVELESDEEMEFGSDDGSSTLDGFEEIDFEEAR